VVEEVSASEGSVAGGHVLQLRGRGFGNVAGMVDVDVAGMPCRVLAAQDTLLTCVTSPWNEELPASSETDPDVWFPGGAGVLWTEYNTYERAPFP
jgi:IPT/TIG domain